MTTHAETVQRTYGNQKINGRTFKRTQEKILNTGKRVYVLPFHFIAQNLKQKKKIKCINQQKIEYMERISLNVVRKARNFVIAFNYIKSHSKKKSLKKNQLISTCQNIKSSKYTS